MINTKTVLKKAIVFGLLYAKNGDFCRTWETPPPREIRAVASFFDNFSAIVFLFSHFSFPKTMIFVSFSKKHRMTVTINIYIFRRI
jgi:hypothetical protein